MVWGEDEIRAEVSRIRRSWIQSRQAAENVNGRGVSWEDTRAFEHAARERLFVHLSDEKLLARMKAKQKDLAAHGYHVSGKSVVNNLLKEGSCGDARRNGNGRPKDPEPAYTDYTGRAHLLLEPPNADL